MSSGSASIEDIVRRSGQRLLDRVPTLEPSLLAARDRYARARIRIRTLRNRLRYDAPPEPYRLIRIDPTAVDRGVRSGVAKYTLAAVVADGDWDRGDYRFEDFDVFRAYRAHFEDGVPWEETEFYDRIVGELEDGRVRWGCRNEAEFRDRCERLDDLYERIRTDGYRTQAELLDGGDGDPIELGRRSRLLTERLKDEIAVHVARDGEILFSDGRNRMSIVKLLGLESVPVRVLQRHADWQAVREAYVHGEPWAADYGDHPDVTYLTFGGADG